ncbi:MAG: hypothetical protein ACRDMX_13730, partial [Solirubrobacteraceae bacterium]
YLTQSFSSNPTYLIAFWVLFLAVFLVLPGGVVPGLSVVVARRRAGAADRVPTEHGRKLPGVPAGTAR